MQQNKPEAPTDYMRAESSTLFSLEKVRETVYARRGSPYLASGQVVNKELACAMAYEQKEYNEMAMGRLALARAIHEHWLQGGNRRLRAARGFIAYHRIRGYQDKAFMDVLLGEASSARVERSFRNSSGASTG